VNVKDSVKNLSVAINVNETSILENALFRWVETRVSAMLLLTWLVWFATKKVNIEIYLSNLFFYFNSVVSYHTIEGTISNSLVLKNLSL
jgi:hypothetical protein